MTVEVISPITTAATLTFFTQRPFEQTNDTLAPSAREIVEIAWPQRHQSRKLRATFALGLQTVRLEFCERVIEIFGHGANTCAELWGRGITFFSTSCRGSSYPHGKQVIPALHDF